MPLWRHILRGGILDNIYNWRHLSAALQQSSAQAQTNHSPRILLAPNVYWEQFINMYTLLAAALRLRGAQVDVFYDDILPACEKCTYHNNVHHLGRHKFDPIRMRWIWKPLGVKLLPISQFLDQAQIKQAKKLSNEIPFSEIATVQLDKVKIGEHAYAGALRYFATGTLDGQPKAEHVLRQYLLSALLMKFATERLFSEKQYDVACFHHGIYVPQGILGEVARAKKIRVVNWNVAYREKCFIFSHNDTYHHTLLDEPTSCWENISWTETLDNKITQYLDSRHTGSKDWISFNRSPIENTKIIIDQLKIDPNKPIIVLLTNVIWDAQLHYKTNIYPNMIAWVNDTITYFSKRPDLQLVIRIHPAEKKGTIPSRQPMLAEINKVFPVLPKNVVVIPPDSSISTYVISNLCNAAIIYGTKTGVELVSSGIPTIVAGEAWIKQKGLTMDPTSVAEYHTLLDTLPLSGKLDVATIKRAKQYAYHFFYRRMIPIKCIQSGKLIFFKLHINSLGDLLPGADPGLDVICRGILTGDPFIYPDEEINATASEGQSTAWLDMR
ncbi:MAG: capsule biosynthesis protein [Patescibacteria group bacterium]